MTCRPPSMFALCLAVVSVSASASTSKRSTCGADVQRELAIAVALFEADKYADAVPHLECARAAGSDPSAALLLGISHHELGHDDKAVPLLKEAAQHPDLADSANVFLALAEWRAGNGDLAAQHFDRAAGGRDPEIARTATDLARLARAEDALMVSAAAHAAYDSNVGLMPTGPNDRRIGPDAAMLVAAAASYRPGGQSGPFVSATVHYRDQLTLDPFDFGGVAAGAGWSFSRGGWRGAAEYAFEFLLLGRDPLETAHELGANVAWHSGAFSVGARWMGRLDEWSVPALAGYRGLVHRGEMTSTWAPSPLRLTVGWRAEQSFLADPSLSSVGHGPRGDAELSLLQGALRLRAGAAWLTRTHAAPEASGTLRADQVLEARTSVGVPLGTSWMIEASAAFTHSDSNVAAYRWRNMTGLVGLSWAGAPLSP